jgi:hypothetical protein
MESRSVCSLLGATRHGWVIRSKQAPSSSLVPCEGPRLPSTSSSLGPPSQAGLTCRHCFSSCTLRMSPSHAALQRGPAQQHVRGLLRRHYPVLAMAASTGNQAAYQRATHQNMPSGPPLLRAPAARRQRAARHRPVQRRQRQLQRVCHTGAALHVQAQLARAAQSLLDALPGAGQTLAAPRLQKRGGGVAGVSVQGLMQGRSADERHVQG